MLIVVLYTVVIGFISAITVVFLLPISISAVVYYFDHKKRDKKYVVSKKGIDVDHESFQWKLIKDLHIKEERFDRSIKYRICFHYNNLEKEFPVDTMTKSIEEIKQILYMYQKWWLHSQGLVLPDEVLKSD